MKPRFFIGICYNHATRSNFLLSRILNDIQLKQIREKKRNIKEKEEDEGTDEEKTKAKRTRIENKQHTLRFIMRPSVIPYCIVIVFTPAVTLLDSRFFFCYEPCISSFQTS